jgi:carbonic anhydrase
MDKLIEGYQRFRGGAWKTHHGRFEALASDGQKPHALIVACSDSRADPSMIFDVAPGELFVVRNVANLVPPYDPDGDFHGTSAALEFGVRVLEVPNIVVMGHQKCGGVHSLVHGFPPQVQDFVKPWMSMAQPALDAAKAAGTPFDLLDDVCEHETVKLSLTNLRGFPWIAEREAAGKLRLHGFRFGIADGVLERLGPDGVFAAV